MRTEKGTDLDPICDRLLIGLSGSIGILTYVPFIFVFKGTVAREIRIIQTPSAAQMLSPSLVGALGGCSTWTDFHDQIGDVRVPHMELPEWADIFLVMPATANVISNAAHGHAAQLLDTAILGSPRPVGFLPSMHERMWNAPSTQRNVAQLREDGHLVLDQDKGSAGAYHASSGSYAAAPDFVDIYNFVLELARASGQRPRSAV